MGNNRFESGEARRPYSERLAPGRMGYHVDPTTSFSWGPVEGKMLLAERHGQSQARVDEHPDFPSRCRRSGRTRGPPHNGLSK
jgi:hypothetical protein